MTVLLLLLRKRWRTYYYYSDIMTIRGKVSITGPKTKTGLIIFHAIC